MGAHQVQLLGCMVDFTLDEHCARAINAKAGQHNDAHAGQVFPALVVRTWSDAPDALVQLQVFYDGDGSLWATSVTHGFGQRMWHHPGEDR